MDLADILYTGVSELLLIRIIESLLVPPGLMFLLMLAGVISMRRYRRTGKALILSGVLLLFLLSLPLVSDTLMLTLEKTPAVNASSLHNSGAEAIVVLGGGRYADAPEYLNDTVSLWTLERLRYAARLHTLSRLPILVSGGSVYGDRPAEALLMQQVLQNDFDTPVRWSEDKSHNTWENARFSASILKATGINTILLVTQAYHIPRARMAFEAAGMHVIPAPTGYNAFHGAAPALLAFLPSAHALENSKRAFHEILGYAWYLLK